MNKKFLLSGRDKELFEMAEQFEAASQEGKHIYMDAEDWADLADWFAIQRKKDLAYEAAENGLSQHPANTALLVQLAYLYLDDKLLEKASSIAETIEEVDLSEVKILKASIYLKRKEDQKAQEILDTIEDKTSLSTIVEVSYMYVEADMPELAWPWLESGKELYGKNEAYMTVLASYYHTAGKLEEAEEVYNQLIDLKPYTVLYWLELARCYYDDEQYEKAIEAAEFAIVSDEECGEAHLLLSNIYTDLDNAEKAAEHYENARKLNAIPEIDSETTEMMEMVENEQYEELYQKLEEKLAKLDLSTPEGEEETVDIYTKMAKCKASLGELDEAYEILQKVMEFPSCSVFTYLEAGTIMMEKDNNEEALKLWEKAESISKNFFVSFYIGNQALKYGELDVAIDHLKEVLEIAPNYPQINQLLTVAYLMSCDFENFQLSNQRCPNPLSPEMVKNVIQYINDSDKDKFNEIMGKIMDQLLEQDNE